MHLLPVRVFVACPRVNFTVAVPVAGSLNVRNLTACCEHHVHRMWRVSVNQQKTFPASSLNKWGWDSAVSIASRYRLHGSGLEPRWRLVSSYPSRPAAGALRSLTTPHLAPMLKCWVITHPPPLRLCAFMAWHRAVVLKCDAQNSIINCSTTLKWVGSTHRRFE